MADKELPARKDLEQSASALTDPVSAFLEVACVPRHSGHASGTLEDANAILARHPQVAAASIYTAAVLADEGTVREFLARDPNSATVKGGTHHWDALTYLCFSRYLRLDKSRSQAFVLTAKALLDAGAPANTGWFEMIDHPNPRPVLESALYGAAGIAQHPGLTRLLLERGADPNDEETPYHVPEGYDNTVMQILLDSGKLNENGVACMLLRKSDWHDEEGVKMVLSYGADPNLQLKFGSSAFLHALRRDNHLGMIALLLDHGADPALIAKRDGKSGFQLAAHRGRGDVLNLFDQRGIPVDLQGLDRLIAACARADRAAITDEPDLRKALIHQGGTLLAEFAGNGNVEGLRCLLDLGVSPSALYSEGDPYFDIPKNSSALHVAAWRGWPAAVKELIARGAPVNALDPKGRTPLALAVEACLNSYWTHRRSPDSVDALLKAGASIAGIDIPTGYDAIDELLLVSIQHKG